MTDSISNVDLLVSTGTIDQDFAEKLHDDDRKAIESLTNAEVQHLITTGHKLGKDFVQRATGGGGHAYFF